MKFWKIRTLLYLKFSLFFVWSLIVWFSFLKNNIEESRLKEWNIVFLLDVSNSMNVKDVFYWSHLVSRIDLAKKIIESNVKAINKNFWLILFSNKFDYFVVSTKDKDSFLTYLDTVNTNSLDGWNMQFVSSFSWLKQVLNPSDTSILISDFDTEEDLSKINFANYTYAIWLWSSKWALVYNRFWNRIYKDKKQEHSSFSKDKLEEIPANSKAHIEWYSRWNVLNFLEHFQNKNISKNKKNINYLEIVWFSLIILSL